MSKPIKFTEALKEQAINEFIKSIESMKMSDGKISYSKIFSYKEKTRAKILFTPEAYSKMISLLMSFSTEVAWHGVGKRADVSTFIISDILVYPQSVSGATVEMDTEKYAEWLMKNDEDDRFNHIIAQGHSHVLMQTSPSGVDLAHQEAILSQLTDDMYYIFMIWNKKLEHTTKIYDLENNVMYDDGDIEYGFVDSDYDVGQFVDEAKKLVVEKKYSTITTNNNKTAIAKGKQYGTGGYYGTGGSGYNYYSGKAQQHSGTTKEKAKTKSDIGGGWKNRGYDSMEDYGYGYFYD